MIASTLQLTFTSLSLPPPLRSPPALRLCHPRSPRDLQRGEPRQSRGAKRKHDWEGGLLPARIGGGPAVFSLETSSSWLISGSGEEGAAKKVISSPPPPPLPPPPRQLSYPNARPLPPRQISPGISPPSAPRGKGPTFGQFPRSRLGSHLDGGVDPSLNPQQLCSAIFISQALSVRTPSHMRTEHSI